MNTLDRLELEITRKCPYNCLHCSTSGGMNNADLLSDETILQIIEDSSKYNIRKIVLTGGEPLLKSAHFFKLLLTETVKNNQLVDIYTSGYGLTNELLSLFSKYNNIKFCVSLEGNENTHDYISQVNGSYLTAVSFIKTIKGNNNPVRLHFTVMKNNYSDLNHIVDFALENSINEIKIFKFVSQGRGIINEKLLTPSYEDITYIEKLISKYSSCIDFEIGGTLFNDEQCCSLGRKMAITNDGYILPCLGLLKYKNQYNNIKDYNLSSIIQNYTNMFNAKECLCDLFNKKIIYNLELLT